MYLSTWILDGQKAYAYFCGDEESKPGCITKDDGSIICHCGGDLCNSNPPIEEGTYTGQNQKHIKIFLWPFKIPIGFENRRSDLSKMGKMKKIHLALWEKIKNEILFN